MNALHPYCNVCGWRKGGLDSWNGAACKCGHYEPPMAGATVQADNRSCTSTHCERRQECASPGECSGDFDPPHPAVESAANTVGFGTLNPIFAAIFEPFFKPPA